METLTNDNFIGINHDGAYFNHLLIYLIASSIIGNKVHDNKDEHMDEI